MHANALEELVTQAINYLVPIVEACGAAIVMLGVIRTIIHHIRDRLRLDLDCLPHLRTQLIESLIMGLEFQLAADVLKTAISPTLNQVILLAALIGLRAALSYLLERELHVVCAESHSGQQHRAEHSAEET
nr:DUF1622 domain-containing protein [Chloroflexota bacterium]